MKKRILINTHCMPVGGAERALLSLLGSIDYDKYSVDLMINRHEGEWMKYIPQNVNLIPEIKDYRTVLAPFSECIKNGDIKMALVKILSRLTHFVYRLCHKRKTICNGTKLADDFVAFDILWKIADKWLPDLAHLGHYDAAISFLMPHYVVANKVNADIKIAWIHSDYSSVEVNKASEVLVWDKFDKIVAISEKTKTQFISVFPELEHKMTVIQNILNADFVRNQATMFYPEEYKNVNGIKIMSMGRFATAKNFEVIPKVARLLKMNGISFRWFILGPGVTSGLAKIVQDTDTADVVCLVPPCDNPYPYIKNADFYVQPSLYEGNCVAVEEAKILVKPIVVTPYNNAQVQIANGNTGVIADGFEPDNIYSALSGIINDKKLLQVIVENLSKADFGNEWEVNKLYELIK